MKIENIRIFEIKFCKVLITTALITMLAACSGGGGGSDSSSSAATGSVSSSGTITGFGSVFVNGVRYSTSNATIVRSGQQVSESNLNVGMQVTVQANSNNNSASRVEFEEDVEGPVDVNNNSGTLSVMGQTVITDAQTVFDNGGLATLDSGYSC